MLRPCNSMVPPKTMPVFGSGTLSVDNIKPIACEKGKIELSIDRNPCARGEE